MNDFTKTPGATAVAVPDRREVRPLYYLHDGPNGDRFRVEVDEVDGHCDYCTAVYDQAALDAAVAQALRRIANEPP